MTSNASSVIERLLNLWIRKCFFKTSEYKISPTPLWIYNMCNAGFKFHCICVKILGELKETFQLQQTKKTLTNLWSCVSCCKLNFEVIPLEGVLCLCSLFQEETHQYFAKWLWHFIFSVTKWLTWEHCMCTSASRNKHYPFSGWSLQRVIYLAQGGLQEIFILKISWLISQVCRLYDRWPTRASFPWISTFSSKCFT